MEKSEHMPPVVRILPAVHNTRCKKDGYFSVSTYLFESNMAMACLFGRKLLVAPFFSRRSLFHREFSRLKHFLNIK